MFPKPVGGWQNATGEIILDHTGNPSDLFGQSLAVDGDQVAVGSGYETVNGNEGQGKVYFYQKPAGGGVERSLPQRR
ncbi:MAG TPA: hypothetical protein VMT46_01510 [Anaerolineaceae bacterium]|nr:hypothetical protein [Anaerolineaceae bacterium]